MRLRTVFGLIGIMTLALIAFTTDVPPARLARAASGGIIITNNCAAPSPSPSSTQQVTYTDQNGFLCTNSQGGGSTPVTVTPSGCGTATLANTATKAINNAGSASNLLLVAGVAAQKVHICGFNLGPVAAAVNVALVEGTTTTNACDTGTAGLAGGVTAATGWQLAANGGLTYGNGQGLLMQAATNADNVCLLFSTGTQVSGVLTYAVY